MVGERDLAENIFKGNCPNEVSGVGEGTAGDPQVPVGIYENPRFTIDYDKRQVFVGGHQKHLTRREFDLLSYFSVNRNRVISRKEAVRGAWGSDYFSPRMPDVVVQRIRCKLGYQAIKTALNFGYVVVDEMEKQRVVDLDDIGFGIDEEKKLLVIDGVSVRPTPSQYKLWEYFLSNPDLDLDFEAIKNFVWGSSFISTANLRVRILSLRNLLRDKAGVSSGRNPIVTVWGKGYRFELGRVNAGNSEDVESVGQVDTEITKGFDN